MQKLEEEKVSLVHSEKRSAAMVCVIDLVVYNYIYAYVCMYVYTCECIYGCMHACILLDMNIRKCVFAQFLLCMTGTRTRSRT